MGKIKKQAKSQRARPAVRPLGVAAVKRHAAVYCLFHYPTLYTAGRPQRIGPGSWQVPIILSSPAYGLMGQVGELTVDGKTGAVLKATDRDQVVAVGTRLYLEKKDGSSSPAPSRKR